jgi:mRNA export factor
MFGQPAGGGLFGGGGGGFGQPQAKDPNTNQSAVVPEAPSDTISALAWSPSGNMFAASSWDKSVRIWEVTPQNIQARMAYQHEAPVLCCNFSRDGQRIVSGGCDGKVKMKMLATQQEQQIGQHDAPVKEAFIVDDMNMVVTGGWDKTIRFWNCQQPNAVATLQLPERVYSMDVKYPLLVVGCAERHLLVYNLQQIQQSQNPYKQGQTALKMQTRTVCAFPDKTGYAVGSIEGRCSIAYVEDVSKNFAFKCHRSTDEIFAVNTIDFHPTMGTFATGGGDGTFVFWDKENRQRLKQFNSCHLPVTAGKFNAQGDMYAYAVGYDWSKGHEGNHPTLPKSVMVHKVQQAEVTPKQGSNQRTRR